MQDFPDKATLLGAVAEFLEGTVRPSIQDQGLAFRVRVAAHIVATVAREVTLESFHDIAEYGRLRALLHREGEPPASDEIKRRAAIGALNAELARALREDAIDDGELAKIRHHVMKTLTEKLTVVQPRFDLKLDVEG